MQFSLATKSYPVGVVAAVVTMITQATISANTPGIPSTITGIGLIAGLVAVTFGLRCFFTSLADDLTRWQETWRR